MEGILIHPVINSSPDYTFRSEWRGIETMDIRKLYTKTLSHHHYDYLHSPPSFIAEDSDRQMVAGLRSSMYTNMWILFLTYFSPYFLCY